MFFSEGICRTRCINASPPNMGISMSITMTSGVWFIKNLRASAPFPAS